VAKALALVEHPIMHVTELPGHPSNVVGQSPVPDDEIARFCGRTAHVLVTIDRDFQGRWIRSGLLKEHGVEVIAFDRDIKGLDEQHRRITEHLRYWHAELGKLPYGHRIWLQTTRRHPVLLEGKRATRRSHSKATRS
jgi:hypothetical protein